MSDLRATVYVSWGLWVADCPRPGCLGAEHAGHAPLTGVVGGLTQSGFRCARCGLVCPSAWPDNAQDIWTLLEQRPLPETRNWSPAETLGDLLAENVLHGITDPAALPEGGPVIANDRLTTAGRQLVAAGGPSSLRQIGG